MILVRSGKYTMADHAGQWEWEWEWDEMHLTWTIHGCDLVLHDDHDHDRADPSWASWYLVLVFS
jgi:hypothetical protein